ncbi:MAG: hypothetical protein HY543_07125 [Deltaproteobacteria bacterium]|nr:hypothetical protein [Deltaproteobacteria bacterium]
MQFHLTLDRDQIDRSRRIARDLALHIEKYTSRHTSVAIERAAVRAMGIDGVQGGQALPAAVVERMGKERLRDGAAYWIGYVMWEKKCDAVKAAQQIVKQGLPTEIPRGLPHGEFRRIAKEATTLLPGIEAAAERRRQQGGRRRGKRTIVVVATGDPDRDAEAAALCAKASAPAVDGVIVRPPLAADQEGMSVKSGGWRGRTYDAPAVMAKIAAAAGGAGSLCVLWGAQQLAAPELTLAAAAQPVAGIEYDAVTLARQGGVHIRRALVDQHFCYRLAGAAYLGVGIGSDRWGATVDAYHEGEDLLLGMFLLEALCDRAGIPDECFLPRHTAVVPADLEARSDHLLVELAHAYLARELFPSAAIGFAARCAPAAARGTPAWLDVAAAAFADYPLYYVDGIGAGKTDVQAVMDLLAARHSYLQQVGELADEVTFAANGKLMRRAHTLLDRAHTQLANLHKRDFLKHVEQETKGLFAFGAEGAGLDGVIQKGKYYWNPIEEWYTKGSA